MSADVRRRLLGLHWIAGLVHGRRDLRAVVRLHVPAVSRRLRGRVPARREHPAVRHRSLSAISRRSGFISKFSPPACCRGPGIVIGRLVDDVRSASERARVLTASRCCSGPGPLRVVGFFTFSRFKLDHYVFRGGAERCACCARERGSTSVRFPMRRASRRPHRGTPRRSAPDPDWRRRRLLSPVAFDLPAATLVVPAVVVSRRPGGDGASRCAARVAAACPVGGAGGDRDDLRRADSRRHACARAAEGDPRHRQVGGEPAPGPDTRVASYQLNRWNTAFRFYVDRHVTMLDADDKMLEFFNHSSPVATRSRSTW